VIPRSSGAVLARTLEKLVVLCNFTHGLSQSNPHPLIYSRGIPFLGVLGVRLHNSMHVLEDHLKSM
jgi:hypothetical protein